MAQKRSKAEQIVTLRQQMEVAVVLRENHFPQEPPTLSSERPKHRRAMTIAAKPCLQLAAAFRYAGLPVLSARS